MANHRSALKAHKQSLVRRASNRHYRSMARKAIKRFDLATEGKDKDAIQSAFSDAERILRRVVGKGIFKHQTANRTISRLAHKRNQALGSK